MADFEDAKPARTWHNMIDGQINLRDAVGGARSAFEQGGQALQASTT